MIRRFVLLCAILFVIMGVAFAATPGYQTSPGVGDILGQGKLQSDPHRIFRMVRNILDTPLSEDDMVIWNLTEDDGVTIGVTTQSGDSAVAGILASAVLQREVGTTNTAAADRGYRNWGWLQTYGKAEVDVAAATQAGQAMGCSSTATEARPFAAAPAGDGLAQGNAGFFYDAASSGDDDVDCFIRLD